MLETKVNHRRSYVTTLMFTNTANIDYFFTLIKIIKNKNNQR